MKTASVQELKAELSSLDKKKIIDVTVRLIRSKLEIKELATYLLFESADEMQFVQGIKAELTDLFKGINTSHLYFARKSLRKIVRLINKYCRFSGSAETEAELRVFFCEELIHSGIPFHKSEAILRIYEAQRMKATQTCAKLHEDIQFEYSERLLFLSDRDGN
jgi:hypothetical protein